MVLSKNKRILILCILVFVFALFNTDTQAAQAASLYFSPSSGAYSIGQILTASVYVSSSDQAINAASGIISFPQDKLQVVSLSKTGSIMSFWVQEPSFSNTSGTVDFEGIVLNPGFIGSNGKIIDIVFKTKASGATPLSFFSASVLASDGKGTNILISSGSASYNIIVTTTIATSPSIPTEDLRVPKAVVISSETHPHSDKWYSSVIAKFSWALTSDITATRLLISKSSKAYPTVIYSPAISSKIITDLGEGIWYFYVQLKNKYGWGDISHFQIQIDNTPPEFFDIEIDNEGDFTNPQPLLGFEAKDSFSGIDFYHIKIGEIHDLDIESNEIKDGFYRIPLCYPGRYQLTAMVIDKVGKYSSVTEDLNIEAIESPIITENPEELSVTAPLIIKGKATANYIVTLFIENEKKEMISSIAKRENENWIYNSEKPLKEGIYTIYAEATDSRGAKSYPSEKIHLVVGSPVYIKIGNFVISYLSIIITFAALIILGILIWLYYWKTKLLQMNLRKETANAEKSVNQAFNFLKREIIKQVAKFDGNDLLSEREEAVNEELKKAIKKSEELIAEEIKDIKEKIDKS